MIARLDPRQIELFAGSLNIRAADPDVPVAVEPAIRMRSGAITLLTAPGTTISSPKHSPGFDSAGR
jgi:hypothetical protein